MADPLPPQPIKEVADPISLLNVLQTPPLGLGDIDATSLVVTDQELATSGSTSLLAPALDPASTVVDDDMAQCPEATFTSINAAIAVTAPGGTVRVCPGTYVEKVLVNKTLTLEAPRHQGQASQCQAPVPADPTKVAIIKYPTPGTNPDIGVAVAANNVVIRGFTVEPLNTPTPGGAVGIFTDRNYSGHRIEHNVLEFNTTGLYLNSTGAVETLVRHNCFRDNNGGGAANGNGIYSDQGLNNATIDNNFFTLHRNAAVLVDHFIGTVSFVRVTHNSVVDDSSIVFFNSLGLVVFHDIVISYNQSQRPDGSAIFVGRGMEDVEISYNKLEDGTANGISVRNDALLTAGAPSPNLFVVKNHLSGFAMSGIRLGGPAGANTHIEKNKSYGNGIDGIRAEVNSSDYTIEKNHMKSNAEHDCHDDSVGPFNPPGNVANPWIDDAGDTQNKAGLCKKATTTP